MTENKKEKKRHSVMCLAGVVGIKPKQETLFGNQDEKRKKKDTGLRR